MIALLAASAHAWQAARISDMGSSAPLAVLGTQAHIPAAPEIA